MAASQIATRGDGSTVRYFDVPLSEFGFLSHLPILTAACLVTTGRVLELGAGFGSTFALHGMCGVQGRQIVTIESDATWLRAFNFYRRKWHTFRHTTTFVDLPEYREEWGLAFVDHGILGQRGLALSALINVPVVVAHDTCHQRMNYHNERAPDPFGLFRYRFDYQWFSAKTSVFSNTVDVQKLFERFGL